MVKSAVDSLKIPGGHCVAGPIELPMKARLIDRSERFDLATIRINPAEITALEVANFRICRPAQWPPPNVEQGDGLQVIGAPRQWKTKRSWSELQLGLVAFSLIATVVKPDELVCQLDPSLVRPYQIDVQTDDAAAEFSALRDLSGSSGGPVFLILNQRGVDVHHLCGIVREEAIIAENRFLYVSRLARIQRNGVITVS